jgi:hypothetical protein
MHTVTVVAVLTVLPIGGGATTALLLASISNKVKISKLLVKFGADINLPNALGATPLYAAANAGSLDVVRLLIKLGADINKKAVDLTTPTWIAAQRGNEMALLALLQGTDKLRGAHVNTQSVDGISPLMVATYFGHAGCVRALLKHGADIKLTAVRGEVAVNPGVHPDLVISCKGKTAADIFDLQVEARGWEMQVRICVLFIVTHSYTLTLLNYSYATPTPPLLHHSHTTLTPLTNCSGSFRCSPCATS